MVNITIFRYPVDTLFCTCMTHNATVHNLPLELDKKYLIPLCYFMSIIPFTQDPILLQLLGHAMLSILSATDSLLLLSVFSVAFTRSSDIQRSINASFGLSTHSREPLVNYQRNQNASLEPHIPHGIN